MQAGTKQPGQRNLYKYLFGSKNVGTLDIAMDDSLLMQINQSFQYLKHLRDPCLKAKKKVKAILPAIKKLWQFMFQCTMILSFENPSQA